MVVCVCGNSEQVMWWQCTAAVCCEIGGCTVMTEEQVCRSVAVVLLWTCRFVKVVWLRMAIAEQNHRQVGRSGIWDMFAFSKVSVGICTSTVFL